MSEEQSLLSHLIELRTRLVRVLLGVIVIFFALFAWRNDIYHWLAQPLLRALPAGGNLIAAERVDPCERSGDRRRPAPGRVVAGAQRSTLGVVPNLRQRMVAFRLQGMEEISDNEPPV